ncbi:DNA repair exonuclease [Tissierella sp. Yu-01]|uniref:metallophosphoesterase family protein n=1 Tax=Tissierella sp. Yu-01 TaxID=3035694 RepID=UPI00240DD606|nr:DNA repair exonuclease [Tissierella sp. Yu-01]WFA09953.1 DNA repair exonuclease [Tissierella sp. Yu-01]
MIKFIHTGDLHLGLQFKTVSFQKEKAFDRRRELWSTFQRIVDYSVKEKADFLFIAGDLFEADYFTLGDIKKVRDILASAEDVNILISAGNHDYLGKNSLYRRVQWSDNVTIFNSNDIEKKVFPELNTNVYGYSWDRVEFRDNKLFIDFPKIDKSMNNILIIHGDVSRESNYLPMSLDVLKGLNMDYIALGHIHKPNIFVNNIAYCGCPEPLDFGEVGPRGIIEGKIENKVVNIQFVPFSKRCFYELRLDLNENLGYLDIINMIHAVEVGTPSKDFYRIKLKGFIQKDINLNDIQKDLEEVFYHLELINETTPDYDLEALEVSNENNIIGLFIKTMKEKNLDDQISKQALYYGLEVLLKDRD